MGDGDVRVLKKEGGLLQDEGGLVDHIVARGLVWTALDSGWDSLVLDWVVFYIGSLLRDLQLS